MSDMDNQEVVDNEEITENAEATPSSPASELVDLVLSGELHAANEKFKSIVEANVIESIEDEKLKIAQTLFAEEPEEGDDDDDKDKENVDEGEMPPALKKAMDKKKGDDDGDEEEDEDEDPVGEKKEELSYDPGKASTNAPLPENSFVQKVAQHLSGQRVNEQVQTKSLVEAKTPNEKEFREKAHTYCGISEGNVDEGGSVTINAVIEGFFRDVINDTNDVDEFIEDLGEHVGFDMETNSPSDMKKMMQAVQKKRLFVERDSAGDSIIGTGPDMKKLEKAILNYRD